MKTLIDKGPGYKGRFFGPPYFVAEHFGIDPGWFVFGRNPEYGGRLVQVVARPDVPERAYLYWNGKRRRGWWLKREAQAVADQLNEEDENETQVV